jgi:catechol 2,3-dioxygenase-like lactoylglutathione lyase family enzyme
MPRFHHVNLGVPPAVEDAEGQFLIDVLGYRKMEVPPGLEGLARWYEADDGSQVHLSIDPDHQPPAMAHTAIEIDDAAEVQARLDAAGVAYQAGGMGDLRLLFCADPAGNRWELRS